MPTNKKRHTCCRCKRKLTEDQMTQERASHYSYKRVWVCAPGFDLVCDRVVEYNKSVRSGSRMDTVGPKVSIALQ